MSGPVESPDESGLETAECALRYAACDYGINGESTIDMHGATNQLYHRALLYAAALCRTWDDAGSNQGTYCAQFLESLAADYGEKQP